MEWKKNSLCDHWCARCPSSHPLWTQRVPAGGCDVASLSSPAGLLYVGFTACMFGLYSFMPVVIKKTSATSVNLSLLTADLYSLFCGLFLFHYKVSGGSAPLRRHLAGNYLPGHTGRTPLMWNGLIGGRRVRTELRANPCDLCIYISTKRQRQHFVLTDQQLQTIDRERWDTTREERAFSNGGQVFLTPFSPEAPLCSA